jgi:hypothetical protein
MRFSPAIAARLTTLVLVSACAGLYAAVGAVAKQDPAAPYLGMSVTDILACAGEPHSRFESGPNRETLVFRYSGAGPVPAEKSKADDKKSGDKKSALKQADDKKSDDKQSGDKQSAGKKSDDKQSGDKKSDNTKLSSIFGKNSKKKENADWTCSASLVFEDGKLMRVTFAHKGVHSPYDWQAERDPEKQEEKRKEGVPTCEFSLPRCVRQ